MRYFAYSLIGALFTFACPIVVGCTAESEGSGVVAPKRSESSTPKIVEFPSKDGLLITADLYLASDKKTTPFIVLCHQAGWSRGEYLEIAPKLVALGFNCMAIDQRSGDEVNGVENKTASRAKEQGLGQTYVDARPDLIAALELVRKEYAAGKIILWGSSYSSALALHLAGEDPTLVDGVLSFAPGEYFGQFGKPKNWVQSGAAKIQCPVFITSAKKEAPQWKAIFEAIPSKSKTEFLPKGDGQHGSRALWQKFPDHEEYWKAVTPFLETHFLLNDGSASRKSG